MTKETIDEAFEKHWNDQTGGKSEGWTSLERQAAKEAFIEGIRWLSKEYDKILPEIKKIAAREGYIAAAMHFDYPQIDQLTAAECAEGWSNHVYGGDNDD